MEKRNGKSVYNLNQSLELKEFIKLNITNERYFLTPMHLCGLIIDGWESLNCPILYNIYIYDCLGQYVYSLTILAEQPFDPTFGFQDI